MLIYLQLIAQCLARLFNQTNDLYILMSNSDQIKHDVDATFESELVNLIFLSVMEVEFLFFSFFCLVRAKPWKIIWLIPTTYLCNFSTNQFEVTHSLSQNPRVTEGHKSE